MNEQNDLVNRQRLRILLWRLPTIAIVASSFLPSSRLKGAIWTVAFGQMGLACVLNAARCGRRHCYFTGPLYLAGAAASLLRGLDLIRIGWDDLGLAILTGYLLFSRLPERIWGKYRAPAS
jgi:hypothetical protein